MATNNDKAYFIEYLGFIEIGATEAEAVIEVANTNEVGVIEVLDALMRQGLKNPSVRHFYAALHSSGITSMLRQAFR